MTLNFEAAERRCVLFARRLLAAGWLPEDVADGMLVAGAALAAAGGSQCRTFLLWDEAAVALAGAAVAS